MQPTKPFDCWHFTQGKYESETGSAIVEVPVSLTVNGDIWLSFMCTPVDLEAMAVGFLYNEGLIKSKAEIADVRVCAQGDNVDVWLTHNLEKPEHWWRTSGCTGGVTSVESEASQETTHPSSVTKHQVTPNLMNGATLSPQQVTHLIQRVLESQDLYRQSGGVHTSALSDGEDLLVVTEDIGRHNTLDKIAGRCLLEDIRSARRVLLTTGRISSEMLQKAARLGAAIVISRTAASSLAIELAKEYGITLISYARRDHFTVYTHPHRIISLSESVKSSSPDQSAEKDQEIINR